MAPPERWWWRWIAWGLVGCVADVLVPFLFILIVVGLAVGGARVSCRRVRHPIVED